MNFQLLLLLLLQIAMGLSAPLEKSNTRPYLKLRREILADRNLGAEASSQDSVAPEGDLSGRPGEVRDSAQSRRFCVKANQQYPRASTPYYGDTLEIKTKGAKRQAGDVATGLCGCCGV